MFLCGWFLSTVLLLFLRARQEFQCWWVFFLLAILYVKWKSLSLSFFLSRFWPFATTGTIQFMEFSRPEYFEQVAFPFSRGSSQPRDRTQVSRIAGGFFPAEPQGKPKNIGVGNYPFSRGSSQPRNQTGSPALQVDSLPTEPRGEALIIPSIIWP